jgi:hypothetical protein
MRILRPLLIVTLLVFAGFGHALAQTADIEGLPIRLGDTYDKVKEVYQTTLVPEPDRLEDRFHPGATELRLKTRGVEFSFDKDGKIHTIGLVAPFRGAVSGVRIGDTIARMREVLGEPIKTLKPPMTAEFPHFIYYIDDQTTARFGTDGDGKVESVVLFK